MKIKAYAICNRTRKGNLYITRSLHAGVYAIFEKKKNAQHYLRACVGSHIEIVTLEIGE